VTRLGDKTACESSVLIKKSIIVKRGAVMAGLDIKYKKIIKNNFFRLASAY
jgi:hypothetical protein